MDYLAILKETDQKRQLGVSHATTKTGATEAGALKPPETPESGDGVFCNSPCCGGCYELWPGGPKIHPPKSSPEWQRWRVRWEKVKQ